MEAASATLNQFKTLHKAIIDTSSLIYLQKIGLLETTADTLLLMTVYDVLKDENIKDEEADAFFG